MIYEGLQDISGLFNGYKNTKDKEEKVMTVAEIFCNHSLFFFFKGKDQKESVGEWLTQMVQTFREIIAAE